MNSSCSLYSRSMAGIITLTITSSVFAGDSVDIRLGSSALKDPLIEYVMPPKGSPDQVQFLADGILIKQVADVKNKKTGVTGLKLLTSAQGDFTLELDFECKKLDRPSSGWGQGLVIRLLTDDPDTPVIAIGCVANKQFARCCWIQMAHGDTRPADRFSKECSFAKGEWIVQRSGKELALSVRERGSDPVEITRMPCTTASLNGIHVWSTRQESGNGAAEFLLKNVKFTSDSFFTYKDPPASIWNGWTLFAIVVGVNLVGYLFYWMFFSVRRSS